MWVMTNVGMLSIVQHNGAGMQDVLVVRARDEQTLQKLLPAYVPLVTEFADYRYRIMASRSDVANLLEDQVKAIDYHNFKNSVVDDELHDAYMGCWSIMARYQAQLVMDSNLPLFDDPLIRDPVPRARSEGRLQRVLDFATRPIRGVLNRRG